MFREGYGSAVFAIALKTCPGRSRPLAPGLAMPAGVTAPAGMTPVRRCWVGAPRTQATAATSLWGGHIESSGRRENSWAPAALPRLTNRALHSFRSSPGRPYVNILPFRPGSNYAPERSSARHLPTIPASYGCLRIQPGFCRRRLGRRLPGRRGGPHVLVRLRVATFRVGRAGRPRLGRWVGCGRQPFLVRARLSLGGVVI
jgi:hypothetical protein